MLRKTMRPRFGPAFQVPFCSSCQRALNRKRNVIGLVVLLVILVGCVLIFRVSGNSRDRVGLVIALIGFSVLPTLLLTRYFVEPFEYFNSRIRFRNPRFTQQWQETWGKPIDFILPQTWLMMEDFKKKRTLKI
jgi:hypothetical protein